VLALVRLISALPEQVDDVEGIDQPLVAAAYAREAQSDDVLVEPFPGADAEREPVVGDDRQVAAACAMIAGW
jgi:hypothetical protein